MSSHRWSTRAGMTVLAVVIALVGAGLIWYATTSPRDQPRGPAFTASGSDITPTATSTPTKAATGRSGSGPKGVPDEITGPILAESHPAAMSIPRLGVRSRLIDLGVDSKGAMEVPQKGAVAGWYTLGPTPGALGPAVIAGHVDWNGQPAIFYRLGTMRVGDRVTVTRADGRTAIFSVTRVAKYPKAAFPTSSVFGSIDYAGLRLITCGGDFDESIGHYKDNVVVFAKLVSDRPSSG